MRIGSLSLLFFCAVVAGCSNSNNNSPVNTATWINDPEVQSQFGPVRGWEAAKATWAWKAIPYAAPPVGALRWKAPQDPQPWTEPLGSDEPGSACTQYSQNGGSLVGSEDCLTLNVWRPQTTEQKLPVYVWIHGGGNTSGSASEPSTDGANLAANSNVVYVSMNYRLGPFGWFYNDALVEGDSQSDSGNFGTLDIIKSLQWIQDNIEQFGGDPDNVFITGESAGGINVLSLLISPRAQGLFHKAMSQSGLLAEIDLAAANQFSTDLLPDILVAEGRATSLAEAGALLDTLAAGEIRELLRTALPSSLMDPVPKIGVGLLSMPILFADGDVIIEDGADSFASGDYPNKVPLILGTNSGDVRLFLFALAGAIADNTLLYNSIADIGGMLWKAAGADSIARNISDLSDQPEVYVYSFEWGRYSTDGSAVTPESFNYLIGAGHSLDIPFFLDTLDSPNQIASFLFNDDNRASRELLSAEMVRYLQNFIRTGNPNSDDLSQQWYPWSNAEGSPKGIVFDASLTELRLGVVYDGISRELALEALEALPDPSLREQVRSFLLAFPISCTLLSDNPSADCG